MRFLTLYKPGRELDGPPREPVRTALGQLIEEMTQAGVLIVTDGLAPSAEGARVRVSDGRLSVIDGPFAETKELIAGYAIIEAPSKGEAIELAKRFLTVMGEGESEIRLMHAGPNCQPADQPAESAAAGASGAVR